MSLWIYTLNMPLSLVKMSARFGRHPAEIFKFLIRMLFMEHLVFIPKGSFTMQIARIMFSAKPKRIIIKYIH